MAANGDNAEALEAAGQDADGMGSEAPNGVMTCRQIGTEHELEEPQLLEIESEIEPPEGATQGAVETGATDADDGVIGATPESAAESET